MTRGDLWKAMDSRPRRPAAGLLRSDIPAVPGVYAWYQDGAAVYSGRAIGKDGLRARIWENHLKTGTDLSRSSFRRNVCEHLNIAPRSITRVRPTSMSPEDVAPVNEWIRRCQVAWIELVVDGEAARFERALHDEWTPPLSKR